MDTNEKIMHIKAKLQSDDIYIWHVLKRIKANRNWMYGDHMIKLLWVKNRPWLWADLIRSISWQSDRCIDYIYMITQK